MSTASSDRGPDPGTGDIARADDLREQGKMLLRQARTREAAELFREATEAAPTRLAPWLYLAAAHARAGNSAGALATLERLVLRRETASAPTPDRPMVPRKLRPHVLRMYGDVLRARGDLQGAEEVYAYAHTLAPANERIANALSAVRCALGRYREGLEVWLIAARRAAGRVVIEESLNPAAERRARREREEQEAARYAWHFERFGRGG